MPWDGNKPGTPDELSRTKNAVYADAGKLKAGAERSLRDAGEAFWKAGKHTTIGSQH